MAFAVADIIDPENDFEQYLDVSVKEYYYDINLEQRINITRIETHRCSDEELGLDTSE